MMATVGPQGSPSLLPLLESLEDNSAGQSEQTDAYLTIANRLSGEEGRQFLPAVEKHFSRLGKTILIHIASPNAELVQAALQALGFCVYHSHVVSEIPETFATEILTALCSLVVKSPDKNTCIRALWVISKQSFPSTVVAKKVSSILGTLTTVLIRENIQSIVMEHEALNVVIRMLEQAPTQMGEGAVQWAKLVVPLVVHSASKVRLRAAAAMEMGLPLLLERQTQVAAVIEPMMSTKLIPELQKLFMSKNETNVLKLWPLFVKLLGKMLHRGGPFINSLLHLEELGFRSSSPAIKKIAFIAWKSLIDNFALNPDILCSTKRMKLLMQPLLSINVRTEALLLTKVEVWWYLVVQLGPNLSSNFDLVSLPLLQCTIGCDSSSVPGTPSRAVTQNGAVTPCSTPKTGTSNIPSASTTPRMALNSSVNVPSTFPSTQLLGLEMLLHYFLGPEAVAAAAKRRLTLSLEPLNHPLLTGASSFTKHATALISNIKDGFISIGKDAPDPLLAVIWKKLVYFVNLTIDSGSKKDRQGCEVLTLMLQALQSIVTSEALSVDKVLVLLEITVTNISERVLGSASYQVGRMDVLNGTPALFLILLLFKSSMLSAYIEDERFFQSLQMLVGYGLSGHTCPLAFAEAVLGAINVSAKSLQTKEHLWRMWTMVVSQLTDTITQSNEVNQGDALEHNFSAMHSALLFPVRHLLCADAALQQTSQKSMLSTWSKLYKGFARCSALVVTAEENVCCEELCGKMTGIINKEILSVPSNLSGVSSILHVMMECADFSPYSPQFKQKLKSPRTPSNWMKKREKALGNLSTFQSLLVECLEAYLEKPESFSEATAVALISIMSSLFANLFLANAVQEALTSLIQPLTLFYKCAGTEPRVFTSQIITKLEKLVSDLLGCLQSRSTLAFDNELLSLLSPLLCVLFPHKNKLLRTAITQFWNATFAKSTCLTYSEEIRPVLSQVKQKTPIILPGFEVVRVSEDLSRTYSSESSQMETKLSGITVSSVGKKDSLLAKADEPIDKSSTKTSRNISTKLDFGSPKPPRREVLEEEASIDFVFIPPEVKDRVLTEHQKEVKRTKRVDIPAMYNNLDASLDSTVFTQYTQNQEDSLDKLPTKQTEPKAKRDSEKEAIETKEDALLAKETQDFASPREADDKMLSESADVSMEEETKNDDISADTEVQSKEDSSPNTSLLSDLVSGTPQKPNSRRQSFITLEKYDEGKSASPSSTSGVFTGHSIKDSQENDNKNSPLSPSANMSVGPDPQNSEASLNNILESPRRPRDSGNIGAPPVRLIERLSSDTTEEDDVIPDTQADTEEESQTMTSQLSSQEEEIVDSQASVSDTSQGEPRRSGRSRVRPLMPGEDPEEVEGRFSLKKKRRSKGDPKKDILNSDSLQGRVTRRSLQESTREKLRTRAQKEKGTLSPPSSQGRTHKKTRLFSNSGDFLNSPEPKQKSNKGHDSSQSDVPSDVESQSLGGRGRRKKASLDHNKKGTTTNVFKEKLSQAATQTEISKQTVKNKDDDEPVKGSQSKDISTELTEQAEKEAQQQNTESDVITSSITTDEAEENLTSPQVVGQSQGQLAEKTQPDKGDSQFSPSCPINEQQELTESPNQLEEKGIDPRMETDVDLSQEDSPLVRLSCGKPKKEKIQKRKALAEEADPVDSTDSLKRPRRSSLLKQAEVTVGGRTRRSVQSAGSSPDTGRLSRRGSPQSSEDSKSSEARENTLTPKKQKRKLKASLQDSPTVECDIDANDNDVANDEVDNSQIIGTQSKEEDLTDLESQTSQDLQDFESNQDEADMESQSRDSEMDVEDDVVLPTTPEESMIKRKKRRKKGSKKVKRESLSNIQRTSSQEEVTQGSTNPEAVCSRNEQVEENLPSEAPSAEDKEVTNEGAEEPQVKGSPENNTKKDPETSVDENAVEIPVLDQEHPHVPLETMSSDGNNSECLTGVAEQLKEDEHLLSNQHSETIAEEKISCVQENDQDGKIQMEENEIEEQTESATDEKNVNLNVPCNLSEVLSATATTNGYESPVKKDLAALIASDVGQSPSSGRTRGTWSPSASPSSSILKKGQKRPFEEDSPSVSPLVKSRRVSFADPIQQQETADDIDRRSPAVRTCSPRRSKVCSIPQPKFITTPTKGLLMRTPRNLMNSGSKSSKKCLISEMSQEPRPIPKDCVYPALVGCSAPVEAVLPQISSTMWCRGFGQLVRAKNIKTVGDLSALTPTEIKTLPVRSPKISNVKKALRIYEQQRKSRNGDDLKSFHETELLTSEPDEATAPQNEGEDKNSAETLATALAEC
uniref:Replication timing regulatory factor 1 n=1 Tax=Cynoglossus semilaevis TaxID=244447 RepID=A0A3P8UZE2_CYNSE